MHRQILGAVFGVFLAIQYPAMADERLDSAVDAYLDEDYSQMAVIAEYAQNGDVTAQAVIGQALWYGMGYKKDRIAGLGWLEAAARAGDRPSAVQLGRLYLVGYPETPKSDGLAAKWFVKAAQSGDTITAPRELAALPRDVVMAAGGEAWAAPAPEAAPEPEVEAPPVAKVTLPSLAALKAEKAAEAEQVRSEPVSVPEPERVETPEPANEPADDMADDDLDIRDQFSLSLIDAIFGPSKKPVPLYTLRDGSTFKILADTPLSTTADLAATCSVVLREKMDADAEHLKVLVDEMKMGNRSRASETAALSESIENQMIYVNMARKTFADPNMNGGFTEAEATRYYSDHVFARNYSKAEPTSETCQARMTSVIADIALSEAEGRYWGE